jgi:hypothetical protein
MVPDGILISKFYCTSMKLMTCSILILKLGNILGLMLISVLRLDDLAAAYMAF